MPKNLPDFLNADISEMKIGAIMTVADLSGDNYTILQDDSRVVCQVRTSRVAVEDEETEEGAEGEEGAAEEGAAEEGATE